MEYFFKNVENYHMNKIIEVLNYYRYPHDVLYFIEKLINRLNDNVYNLNDFIFQQFDLIEEVYYTLALDVVYEIENKLDMGGFEFSIKNENVHCKFYMDDYMKEDFQNELNNINKNSKDKLTFMTKRIITEVGLKLFIPIQERIEKINLIENEY